jgi:hypothetical protein
VELRETVQRGDREERPGASSAATVTAFEEELSLPVGPEISWQSMGTRQRQSLVVTVDCRLPAIRIAVSHSAASNEIRIFFSLIPQGATSESSDFGVVD